ncbi:MAG: VOC family protein [Chloroflexota bacterium]
MKDCNFIWTDLSTFDLGASKDFYTQIFGWQFKPDDDYHFAYVGLKQAAGLFVMPEKFQQMGLPSFWMSYMSVTDIERVVDQAKTMGGIVEVKPTDFIGQGKIALIRDPAGAGFTVWEGPDLAGKDTAGAHGRMSWNELYVSDATLVLDFYRTVFGWSFTTDQSYGSERYDIHNGVGTLIAALEVVPNEVKGKDEFWVPYFSVQNLPQALTHLEQKGGNILQNMTSSSDGLALVQDPQGASFMITDAQFSPQTKSKVNTLTTSSPPPSKQGGDNVLSRFKIRTFLALVFVYIAVVFELQWMWGLLFLLWLIPDMISGQAHLAEPISRKDNPIWYWLIILTWLWMSIYLLLTIFL